MVHGLDPVGHPFCALRANARMQLRPSRPVMPWAPSLLPPRVRLAEFACTTAWCQPQQTPNYGNLSSTVFRRPRARDAHRTDHSTTPTRVGASAGGVPPCVLSSPSASL